MSTICRNVAIDCHVSSATLGARVLDETLAAVGLAPFPEAALLSVGAVALAATRFCVGRTDARGITVTFGKVHE